jgi:hypothetical protein
MDEIILILDRSYSMSSIWSSALKGVNEFINSQADMSERNARFTFATFDTQYEILFSREELRDIPRITRRHVTPRGWTALYDAIGKTINEVSDRLDELPERDFPEYVIMAIYTDGLENASTEFSRAQIRSLIQEMQNKCNWEILFLGANIDAFDQAGLLGIDKLNTKQVYNTATSLAGSSAGLGVYVSSLRGGMSRLQSSEAFDTEYQAIVGEDPSKKQKSSAST